ncbi:MAG: replicative DNA helicase [Microthrixaceae bacterium]
MIPPTPGDDGRIPPHNIQAEESLLGAMLLKQSAISDCVQVVHAADFYKPANQHIFDAIAGLYAAGEPVDPVTVAAELQRAGLLDSIGGSATLLTLMSRTPAVSNATHYARLVEETSLLRQLVSTAGTIAELGYAPLDDVPKTLDYAESLMYEVGQRRITDTTKHLRELLDDSLDKLQMLADRGDEITGTPSGYTDLDHLTRGLQPSSLVVVGARPAMGKTAFALGAAANASIRSGKNVLFFSLEMSHLELTERLLSSEGRINASKIRTGALVETDWDKVTRTMARLGDAPLWIDDNPNLTIMDIRAKARRLQSKTGQLGLVVVDYLQLMSGRAKAANRQVEISEISRGLKILARELECPVMALSQLSRALESRGDRKPMLSDLRESGSIEQDADVVMFLYRDEVYNPDSPDKGKAQVIVAKHRAGPVGSCQLAFLDYCTRFENIAHQER